jgi:predicted O-methyltransferase YrrM
LVIGHRTPLLIGSRSLLRVGIVHSVIAMIKQLVKKTPVVRNIARKIMQMTATHRQSGFVSSDYWEQRYKGKGNSGGGSYNRLSEFKAKVLNDFVSSNGVGTIIEFGSGDGSQLLLAEYPKYIGVDVSKTAIQSTRETFKEDVNKRFVHFDELENEEQADLSISLDVVYHLVEDAVYEDYMRRLFDAAIKFVIVYSSNTDQRPDSVHVKHRQFTDWVERNRPDFKLTSVLKNPYPEDIRDLDNTSFADFFFFERISHA